MEIERKQTITYRWWNSDAVQLNSEHLEYLDEEALDHIHKMLRDGYTSGELHKELAIDSNLYDFQGWWEVATKTTKNEE